jgi:nucleolar pre-ribosomal-associated protein 1
MRVFQDISNALEEDEEDGQWRKRQKDIALEARRRIPDFQVIVGFSQQKFNDKSSVPDQPPSKTNAARVALLAESAQRLMWLYQRCLPSVVAEARFEPGKLLQGFSDGQVGMTGDVGESHVEVDGPSRLLAVRQLHVLRLLKESDQFVWSGKPRRFLQCFLQLHGLMSGFK